MSDGTRWISPGMAKEWQTTPRRANPDPGRVRKVQVKASGGRGTRTHKSLRTTVFKTVRLPVTVALRPQA
jgi:hypothetical protein